MKHDDFSGILQRVRAFCEAEALLTPLAAGKPLHLAAAVSGGADSMALLHLLLALQAESGFVLSVCHVNHGLRGETADRDEAFVREACAELGLPLRVFRPAEVGFTVPPHAGEDWARRLRYACFEQLRQEGIDCIATAHTASDQAETLLFRLARGTGLHGAGGIRPKRPGYCRPLLGLTRAETEAVCTARGQRWVTDETNTGDDYARNRLRHGMLPLLAAEMPELPLRVTELTALVRADDALLDREAERLLLPAPEPLFSDPCVLRRVRLAPLREAPEPLQRRALRCLLREALPQDAALVHIRALHKFLQDAELLFGAGRHQILPLFRQDGQVCDAPLDELFIVDIGRGKFHQMTHTPAYQITVTLPVTILPVGRTEDFGIGHGYGRFFRHD